MKKASQCLPRVFSLQTMSAYGLDVVQSWTDGRLAAVTHELASAAVRLSADQVDAVWTPRLHVVNAAPHGPLPAAADRQHRVMAISTGGLVILHQR